MAARTAFSEGPSGVPRETAARGSTLLTKAIRRITAARGVEATLESITDEARGLIGAHQAVSSRTVDKNWAQAISAISLSERYASWKEYNAATDGSGIYSLVCQNNEPMRMTQAELEAHPAWRGFGTESDRHPPMRGWLAVPLVGRDGQNVGLVQLSDKYDEDDFTEHDEQILVDLANVAAIALENAELYEQLQQANATLEDRVAERTAELEHRAWQLRAMTAELTQAEQRERRRIADLLHDELQQLLAAARVQIIGTSRQPEGLGPGAERATALLDQAIEETRSLTAQLVPPVLYEVGFTAAVESLGRWMYEQQGLQVEVHAASDAEPTAEDQRVLLFQSVRELLFNATQHGGAEWASVALCRDADRRVVVTVSDGGRGFDVSVGVPQPAAEGRFGLFSMRERIAWRGGDMRIDSVPGHGTTITLTLPGEAASGGTASADEAKQPSCTSGVTSDAQSTAISVVLADDHTIVREGITNALSAAEGITVVGEAANGADALDLVRRLHPDVAVLDVTMPKMSGVEVAEAITAELPDIRVIALSVHEAADMEAAMREAGAIAYVNKADASDRLLAVIRGDADSPLAGA